MLIYNKTSFIRAVYTDICTLQELTWNTYILMFSEFFFCFKKKCNNNKKSKLSHLVRSCLLQVASWPLVSVLACVKCICWNWPFLTHRSTAFLHISSKGALDSAPISFSSTSAVTSRPILCIVKQRIYPRTCDGNPMICKTARNSYWSKKS